MNRKSAFRGLLTALILLPGIGFTQEAAECDLLAYENLRDQVVQPLFESLQAGDVAAINSYLSPRMANEYRRLFEQNAEYGAFLRDYYLGSAFELISAQDGPEGTTAMVRVYWSDGRSVDVELEVGGSSADLIEQAPVGTCP